jgi:hypothetical protein
MIDLANGLLFKLVLPAGVDTKTAVGDTKPTFRTSGSGLVYDKHPFYAGPLCRLISAPVYER